MGAPSLRCTVFPRFPWISDAKTVDSFLFLLPVEKPCNLPTAVSRGLWKRQSAFFRPFSTFSTKFFPYYVYC